MRASGFRSFTIGLLWVWLGLFVLLPNLMVLAISFLRRHESELLDWTFSLVSYGKLLDPIYLNVFFDSFWLALNTTIVCLLVGYPFAWLMAQCRPWARHLLLLLVIIPFWTNSLIRTYAIKVILTTNGIANQAMQGLGLTDEPVQLLYTGGAVTLGMVYVLLPFMILPLYANIEKLDHRLLEAAYDLGARPLQVFRKVVLPLTLPGIIAGCLLVFLPALGIFYIPDLLGGSKDLVIGNFIKNQFLDARDWPFGSAASVLLTLLMGLLMWAYYLSLMLRGRRPSAGEL